LYSKTKQIKMRKQIVYLALLAVSAIGFNSCGNSTAQNRVVVTHAPQQPVATAPQNVSVQSNDVPGFDVNGFANLLKTTTNPDALTQAINQPGNSINNLDLDNDGNIDYLKVDQTGGNTLAVFDETPSGKTQIATLTVNTQNNSYVINGSPDYCGNTYIYQSQPGLTFGQYMFLSWMLRPHPYYHPYWGYHRGYYRGYGAYRSHYRTSYNPGYMRTRTTTTRTVVRNPSYSGSSQVRQSPTQVRPSAPAPAPQRTSISNPTQSQRSFSTGGANNFRARGSNTSGFGGSRAASPSPSRSSSSSSSRSFGGSRSSFGGSRSSGGRRR
jgi:hypothetical protein